MSLSVRQSQHSDSQLLRANLQASAFGANTEKRTLNFTNGDNYQGETLGDLRHGRGKHTCSNGDIHEGGWYKGMRHGRGLATFARGFIYEGDFQYDHASGSGKAKYENGGVYEGEFENDMRDGWGSHCFPDESIYVGEWAHDKIAGNGRLTFKDGSYYEGSWEDGQRKHGKWVSADRKEEYRGDWVEDKRHGAGTLHVSGLLQFTGEWQNDLQHGQGKCRWTDGSQYSGNWQEGHRHGQGKMNKADGCKYDGNWFNDEEHGPGNIRLATGDRYTGDFLKGQPHGHGRSVTSGGDKYTGEWREGQRHGKGKCIFANGDKYQGSWVEGRRQGEGSCQFADGRLFRGEWQEDSWLQSEAEPSLSKLTGPGLAQAVAGLDAAFTIIAYDGEGYKRLSGGDEFLVWLEGPVTVHAEVEDREDGTYTATYSTTMAGIYELYITNDTGESVAESPYPLRIVAGKPTARKSCIQLCQPGSAIINQVVEFMVESRDTYNNRCYLAKLPVELPLEFTLTSNAAACHVDSIAGPGGSFFCSFTPHQPGSYRLAVISNGHSLANSPVSVIVKGNADEGPVLSSDQRLVDKVLEWEQKAAEQYKEDGFSDGWNSDESEPETAEQRYIREHPDVPVVENLRDMWKVTKLQQERKAKQGKEKALHELEELKAASQPAQAEGLTQDSSPREGVQKITAAMSQQTLN